MTLNLKISHLLSLLAGVGLLAIASITGFVLWGLQSNQAAAERIYGPETFLPTFFLRPCTG